MLAGALSGSPARLNVVEEAMQGANTAPLAPRRAVEPLQAPDVVGDLRSLRMLDWPNSDTCALCGDSLQGAGPRGRVRSPYGSEELLVCRTCRRVAVGEGYRPVA